MDNASKALVMAGGVMIAIAIIGIAVAAFSHAAGYAKENENAMSISQIEGFNRFYTAYLTSYSGTNHVRCIDAVNILNRAIEDEVTPTLHTTVITDNNGYFEAQPQYYVSKILSYELRYGSDGAVSEVIIGGD